MNIPRDLPVHGSAAAPVPCADIAAYDDDFLFACKWAPRVDRIRLLPGRKKLLIVVYRQQCCREKDRAPAPIYHALQVSCRVYAEKIQGEMFFLIEVRINHVIIIHPLESGNEI